MAPQQQLEQQKRSSINKVAPEIIQTMAQVTADLKASGIENRALGRGDQGPGFTLTNARGEEICLTDLFSRGPMVVNIYRGRWCPTEMWSYTP